MLSRFEHVVTGVILEPRFGLDIRHHGAYISMPGLRRHPEQISPVARRLCQKAVPQAVGSEFSWILADGKHGVFDDRRNGLSRQPKFRH